MLINKCVTINRLRAIRVRVELRLFVHVAAIWWCDWLFKSNANGKIESGFSTQHKNCRTLKGRTHFENVFVCLCVSVICLMSRWCSDSIIDLNLEFRRLCTRYRWKNNLDYNTIIRNKFDAQVKHWTRDRGNHNSVNNEKNHFKSKRHTHKQTSCVESVKMEFSFRLYQVVHVQYMVAIIASILVFI